MPYLVADTPYLYCLVRREFLRDGQDGHGEYVEGCIFGVTALEGRLPAFQAMLKDGAQFARLPLVAFCEKPSAYLEPPVVCLWDSLSYTVAAHQYSYLTTLVADVFCGDGVERRGKYLFTLDWAESDYAEMPDQHKCHHLFWLDSGQMAGMPNNRVRWHEPSWVQPFVRRPDYLVQTRTWTTERLRSVADGNRMFYRQDGESAHEGAPSGDPGAERTADQADAQVAHLGATGENDGKPGA